MPLLAADGTSDLYSVISNDGVHIKGFNVSGTVNFEQFDAGTSMGNLKDDAGTDIAKTADFDIHLDLKNGDVIQVVQTGGTPTATRVVVSGAS